MQCSVTQICIAYAGEDEFLSLHLDEFLLCLVFAASRDVDSLLSEMFLGSK